MLDHYETEMNVCEKWTVNDVHWCVSFCEFSVIASYEFIELVSALFSMKIFKQHIFELSVSNFGC